MLASQKTHRLRNNLKEEEDFLGESVDKALQEKEMVNTKAKFGINVEILASRSRSITKLCALGHGLP